MSAKPNDKVDEEAAMEAAVEKCAAPHPRESLRREYDEVLKGRPRNVALEKWGPELEVEILRDLESTEG
jgi:hypothetical protein